MRISKLGILMLTLGVAGCGPMGVMAQITPQQTSDSSVWIGGAPGQTHIVLGDDGSTYVGVWVEAPTTEVAVERGPLALSLVVDTSGSMGGEKINNARLATLSLLEQAQDGDIVSIYGFSQHVSELAPPTVINAHTRSQLMQRVQVGMHAGGGTNLHGGLTTGINALSRAPSSHGIRRLMLISDGHANVGPSDPGTLSNVAVQGTEFGVQVSTIGVGAGYSESLLGQIAVRTAGRLYHLMQPHQLAAILDGEMRLLSQTVASNAVLEIHPANGVVFTDTLSLGGELRDGVYYLPLGTLYGGQRRQVLLRANLSAAALGPKQLGVIRLGYEEPNAEGRRHVQEVQLGYRVTNNRTAAANTQVPRVSAMVADHEATVQQRQAVAMLNSGQGAQAAQALSAGASRLRSAAAAAPADSATRSRLRRRAESMEEAAVEAEAARSMPAARAAALSNNDMAMEAEGF